MFDKLKQLNRLTKTYNAGLLQGKAYRILEFHLSQTLSPYNLSIPEWKLLGQLVDQDKLKIGEIADLLDVDPPLVTVLVQMLQSKKMVDRRVDENDRRVNFILPTFKGRDHINALEKDVSRLLKQLLSGISSNELYDYMKVLRMLSKNGSLKRVKKL